MVIQACVFSSDIINQMQLLSCLRDCDDNIHLPPLLRPLP